MENKCKTTRMRATAVTLVIVGSTFIILSRIAPFVIPAEQQLLISYGASLLFNFSIIALFVWLAQHNPDTQTFWRWLALGWLVNQLGNIAWGVYDIMIEGGVPTLSWVDSFYLTRYLLIFLAFRLYLPPKVRRHWGTWGLLTCSTAAIVWMLLLRPAMLSTGYSFFYFAGIALYPVLDIPLIYAAASTWKACPKDHIKHTLGLLTLGMITYGIANWLNFSKRTISLDIRAGTADIFWQLTDILAWTAGLYTYVRRDRR
ncbi:MAG: hypothetical protein JXA33_06270 [Anaerolineae bacterium]|nr:hypothetical protein [Anaerolineae bacterium]